MQSLTDNAIEAVKSLSRAIRELRAAGVIRSRRFTGDLGEWYVEQLYNAERPRSQTQKGWDILLPECGERLQVKTQSFDPQNRWNYLDSDPSLFDRLVLIILTDSLTIRNLYDIPTSELHSLLRVGKEKKPYYHWDDFAPWRVDPRKLPGYNKMADLVEIES
ncbi:MAG: hypothetical protein IT330_12320 [Anaerolineae bacterium]|nr:hypothetical protein [Anaerolineae bacterium]